MKNKMFNLILGQVLIFLFVLNPTLLFANQIESADIVNVRMEESTYKKDCWLKIVDNGQLSIIHLTGYNSDKVKTKNFKTISTKIEEYLIGGYKIVSASSAIIGVNLLVTSYILIR